MEIIIMVYYEKRQLCMCMCDDEIARFVDPFTFCFPGANGDDLVMKRFSLPETVDINADDIITPLKNEMTEVEWKIE